MELTPWKKVKILGVTIDFCKPCTENEKEIEQQNVSTDSFRERIGIPLLTTSRECKKEKRGQEGSTRPEIGHLFAPTRTGGNSKPATTEQAKY